jgi:cation transport protein ChaC
MGDNALGHLRPRPARLRGWHRAFNHRSVSRWGRPERPCPILGLRPGGECWGLAFELPRRSERATLRMLARREAAGEYERTPLPVELPDGSVRAWVALSRPEYVNGHDDDLDVLVARLRAAHGVVGTGDEYVRTLAHALEQHALRDALIEALWRRLGH